MPFNSFAHGTDPGVRLGSRIDTLDGFRFFAILSVMLFHFYSRWSPPASAVNLYPYQGTENYFSYGYLGVQFFFIISGFVISYTLTKTASIYDFWKKRMVRLLPAMFVCSIVTLIFFCAFDRDHLFPDSHSVTNFFYSLTFISPTLLDRFLRFISVHGNYTNGSYWSLWPEVQFYGLVSVLYYIRPKNFFKNFTLLALFMYVIHRLLLNIQGSNLFGITCSPHFVNAHKFWIQYIFNLPYFILWFLMGVLFYQIFSRQHKRFTWFALVITICLQQQDSGSWKIQSLTFLMLFLFILFLWRPSALDFIGRRVFTSIGVASYSLYLIHENIGVYLIHHCGAVLGKLSVLFPFLVIGVFVVYSLLLYRFVEKPISRYFKSKGD